VSCDLKPTSPELIEGRLDTSCKVEGVVIFAHWSCGRGKVGSCNIGRRIWSAVGGGEGEVAMANGKTSSLKTTSHEM
jgi:hypothetical protein